MSSSLVFLAVWSLLLCVCSANHSISVTNVQPNVSPLAGGVEVFITGRGFSDGVQAEFSVLPGALNFLASYRNNSDGTVTASFFAPASTSTLSSFGSWVRLVDSHAYSGAWSFFWEDPVSISSVVASALSGDRTQYTVTGAGFYNGIRCATPIHPPVNAKVRSATSLTCTFNNRGFVSELILIQKSGATVSYFFPIPTTGTTGTSGTTATTSSSSTTGSTGTTAAPATTGTSGTTGTNTNVTTRFGSATYVYAWSGAVDRLNPDYVAIIDAVPSSPTYRKVVGKAELPAEFAINNEPHHMQFVNNNTFLVAGGLLSILNKPQELFIWNISSPTSPTFIRAEAPPTASVIDDIIALPQGGFLVSIMGAADGTSPGAIGEWDSSLNFVGEWPVVNDRPRDMNPHGITYDAQRDILMTTDFVDPASTLNSPGGPVFRDTIRIWKPWSQRKVSTTVKIPDGRGLMDVRFLPKHPDPIAYTTNIGTSSGMIIFAINATDSVSTQVFNMSKYFTVSPRDYMLHTPTEDGTKYLITNSYTGLLMMLDTVDPMKPRYLDSVVFGIQSGIHAVEMSDDSKFVMVSGYFLDEDSMGVVHEDGDRSVHIAEIIGDGLTRTEFDVNLNTAVPYPMRPHMIRFFNTKTTTRLT